MEWEVEFRKKLAELEKVKPIIWCWFRNFSYFVSRSFTSSFFCTQLNIHVYNYVLKQLMFIALCNYIERNFSQQEINQ